MDKGKILIIDDDYNGAKSIKEALQKDGYSVSCAYNSLEGFEELNKLKPDLILLDLVLPGESGFRIAQDIKANPNFQEIPIVAISLKKENIDKHIASKCGFIGYVEKPIDLKRLIYIIKDTLRED